MLKHTGREETQINQMCLVAEMGKIGIHVWWLAQKGSAALHGSARGLWTNFNVTKRIFSQAEHERGHLLVFQETLDELLSKAGTERGSCLCI